MELCLVLGQDVSGLGLLATHLAVPGEVTGEVDGLHVVLHVHLPLVGERAAAAGVSAAGLDDILHEIVIASHPGGLEAWGLKLGACRCKGGVKDSLTQC